eukprot:10908187-Lingulodinium_polyedra.AAC.1
MHVFHVCDIAENRALYKELDGPSFTWLPPCSREDLKDQWASAYMPGSTVLDKEDPWLTVCTFLLQLPLEWKRDMLTVMRATMTEYDTYQYELEDIIIKEIAQSMHFQQHRSPSHAAFDCVEGFSGWSMLTAEMRKAKLKAVALDKKYDVVLDL